MTFYNYDTGKDEVEEEFDEELMEEEENDCNTYEDEELIDGVGFADPTGRSALRAETKWNRREYDCPTCGRENVLTRIDKERGYQCDECADRAEQGLDLQY